MFEMILGQFIGDYLLQPKWMALEKEKNTWLGWYQCFNHCFVYTLVVCVMMMNYNPYWMLCVFLSHFFIDKFGLGKYWLVLIEGRSLKQFLIDTKNRSIDGMDVIQGSFGTLVYTIVDNTLHIIIMYVCYKCLFGN